MEIYKIPSIYVASVTCAEANKAKMQRGKRTEAIIAKMQTCEQKCKQKNRGGLKNIYNRNNDSIWPAMARQGQGQCHGHGKGNGHGHCNGHGPGHGHCHGHAMAKAMAMAMVIVVLV